MNEQSQRGGAFADAMTRQQPRRLADTNLREKNQRLITKISNEQMAVFEMTLESTDDKKWKAVACLVGTYEGQARIVNPEKARWILANVLPGQQTVSSSLIRNLQFCVPPTTTSAGHGCAWLSKDAGFNIDNQVLQEATDRASSLRHPDENAWPDWTKQVVTVAVPCKSASGKEWHLDACVMCVGQLLLALGHMFSAADIEQYWNSLVVVLEKRSKTRRKNRQ